MKLAMSCNKCAMDPERKGPEFTLLDLRDDGRYEYTCPRNHKNVVALQQHKFELFYDAGVQAIVDEYYRDAVVCFATSLERFHEFAIRVLMEDTSGSDAVYRECWKKVASQSERQLGAFIFTWAHRFGASPATLSNSDVGFRNAVVHKGKFATKDEAIAYAHAVLCVLRENLAVLTANANASIEAVLRQHIAAAHAAGMPVLSIPTIVSLTSGWDPPMTLERYIDYVRERPKAWSRHYRT